MNFPESISKIDLYYKSELKQTIKDKTSLSVLKQLLLSTRVDNSKDDFKSFYFLSIYDDQNNMYRIEIFKDRFRYQGKRYEMSNSIYDVLGIEWPCKYGLKSYLTVGLDWISEYMISEKMFQEAYETTNELARMISSLIIKIKGNSRDLKKYTVLKG